MGQQSEGPTENRVVEELSAEKTSFTHRFTGHLKYDIIDMIQNQKAKETKLMTKEEALRIAAEAASELVLHDLPKRLHEAGVSKISQSSVQPQPKKQKEVTPMEKIQTSVADLRQRVRSDLTELGKLEIQKDWIDEDVEKWLMEEIIEIKELIQIATNKKKGQNQ